MSKEFSSVKHFTSMPLTEQAISKDKIYKNSHLSKQLGTLTTNFTKVPLFLSFNKTYHRRVCGQSLGVRWLKQKNKKREYLCLNCPLR